MDRSERDRNQERRRFVKEACERRAKPDNA